LVTVAVFFVGLFYDFTLLSGIWQYLMFCGEQSSVIIIIISSSSSRSSSGLVHLIIIN